MNRPPTSMHPDLAVSVWDILQKLADAVAAADKVLPEHAAKILFKAAYSAWYRLEEFRPAGGWPEQVTDASTRPTENEIVDKLMAIHASEEARSLFADLFGNGHIPIRAAVDAAYRFRMREYDRDCRIRLEKIRLNERE